MALLEAKVQALRLFWSAKKKSEVVITLPLSYTYFFFQLKNAFDNLFEGLMESKDGEKEAAEVSSLSVYLSAFYASLYFLLPQ